MNISTEQFRDRCRPLAIRDRHHEVLDLMQQVPLEFIQSDDDLAFWHARCLLSTVKYVDGKQAADEYIRRYATADNALSLGRSYLLRSHLCIMDGDTAASYNHELQVVSILPKDAYHERLRSWATIDTMAGHLGDNTRIELAAEALSDIRNHLPFDQSWWYSFVVPNRADILAKRGWPISSDAWVFPIVEQRSTPPAKWVCSTTRMPDSGSSGGLSSPCVAPNPLSLRRILYRT